MADNEIRNPAKAYFKWKMPVITKSEDDWNFWNTEDKYNRTIFIGYNDTTTPHVASLFIIVDGKAMQAVGDDVIARIAGLETNTAQALADIQALIDRVNAQQGEISNLQQECQRILEDAESAVRAAQIWAEGTDAQVAEKGGEHSAKGWAQKANDIVASGLPSDATFDHLTVTGNSKFGQDPDRGNQPGLEIEGTGEIQAYRTVNMMNGATVSYNETVEMPWSDSSNKVPNTKWVQDAIIHGSGVDPNSDVICQNLTVHKTAAIGDTSTVGYSIKAAPVVTPEGVTEKYSALTLANVYSNAYPELSSFKIISHMGSHNSGEHTGIILHGDQIQIDGNRSGTPRLQLRLGSRETNSFYNPHLWSLAGHAEEGFVKTGLPFVISGGSLFLYSEPSKPDAVLCALGGMTTGVGEVNGYSGYAMLFQRKGGKHEIDFGITPTVPDITDAADSSSKVPNTKWVQAAIAASGGGSGGGAVSSVNGKTGEVVLNAADVGAITGAEADTKITTALEPYAKTADVTTTLAGYATTDDLTLGLKGKQDELTAGTGITISADNVISATGGGTGGGAVDSVNGKTGAVVLTGEDIRTSSYAESATIAATFGSFAQMIETKQDKITATTALTAGSYDTDVGTYYTHIGQNGLQVNNSSAVNQISLNMDDGLITPTAVSFTGTNKTFTVASTSVFNGKAAFTKPVTITSTVSVLNGSKSLFAVNNNGVKVNLTGGTTFDCYTSEGGTNTSVCTITDGGITTNNATLSSMMTVTGAATLSSIGNTFDAETTCSGKLKTTGNVTSNLFAEDGEKTVLSLDTTAKTFKVSSVGGADMLNCNLATGEVNLQGMTLMPAEGESSASIIASAPITADSLTVSGSSNLMGGFISSGYSSINGDMGLYFMDGQYNMYAHISPADTSFINVALTGAIPADDNTNRAATTEWVNSTIANAVQSKADAANTVTTDTTQTITAGKNLKTGGTVAYSRPLQIFMPTSTESNPTEDKIREIAFLASDGTGERYEGSLTHSRSTTGESYTGLRVGRLVNGTFKEGALGVRTLADGTTFGTAPNTPDSAPANAIVTKDKIANMVTTDTVQTITGVKVFTGEQRKKATNIDITAEPTTYKANNAIRFVDSNDKSMGFLENAQISSGEITTGIHARNKDDYQQNIGVWVPRSGTTGAYATAPNTPDNPAGNVIVTADYLKNNYVDKTSTQTISGTKRFTQPSAGMSIELVADTNQQTVPAANTSRLLGLYRNSTYTKGDGYSAWLEGNRGANGNTSAALYTRRFLESDSQEIVNYVNVYITPEGIPVSYTRTPPDFCTGEEIATAAWVRNAITANAANINADNFSVAGKTVLSGMSMPSGRYIDLTLGASDSTYTAPANGWFVISGKPTADGGYCIMDTNNYEPTYMTTNTSGWYDRGFIPVRKGQIITLRYGNYEFESNRFKFIYAEGENNV